MITAIVTLTIIGILAILLELFLPGGVLGIIGGLLLLAACVLTFGQHGFTAGLIYAVSATILTSAVFGLWMKYFHRLPIARNLILQESLHRGDSLDEDEVEGGDAKRHSLIGEQGTALTPIQPSGRVRFGDRRLDVITEGPAIESGSLVEVVDENPTPVVREVARKEEGSEGGSGGLTLS